MCGRGDSNSQGSPRYHLKVVRLPVSPPPHFRIANVKQVYKFIKFERFLMSPFGRRVHKEARSTQSFKKSTSDSILPCILCDTSASSASLLTVSAQKIQVI